MENQKEIRSPKSLEEILDIVAHANNVTVVALKGRARPKPITDARMMYYGIALKLGYGSVEIGRFLGGRDHGTVVHGARMCDEYIETDKRFREVFSSIISGDFQRKTGTQFMVDRVEVLEEAVEKLTKEIECLKQDQTQTTH